MARTRFEVAIAAIDAANTGDPATIDIGGVERPKERAHAELMTEWVKRLDPDADEAQLLAARAHHLRRWAISRTDYPEGRSGYLRWRAELKRLHAREVATILAEAGFDESEIARVQQIIRKEGLPSDDDVQTHEDALCMVFLTTQFEVLIDKLGTDKAVDVVRKTIAKMSAKGRAEAMELSLSNRASGVVGRALEPG